MQIKGTFMLDFIKLIRANKDKDWDKWLTPEDREIIESKVLPSNWYPFDSWQRIGNAVFNEMAGGNLDLIRAYGPTITKNLLNVYSHVLVEGDPAASIEKFEGIRKTFLKGMESNIIITERGTDMMKLEILSIGQEDTFLEAFAHATMGGIEELVKLAGGKNIEITIQGAEDGYELEVKWE